MAVLTGDRINAFFYKEMYGRFAGPKKKPSRDKEVAVRRGSTVEAFLRLDFSRGYLFGGPYKRRGLFSEFFRFLINSIVSVFI